MKEVKNRFSPFPLPGRAMASDAGEDPLHPAAVRNSREAEPALEQRGELATDFNTAGDIANCEGKGTGT